MEVMTYSSIAVSCVILGLTIAGCKVLNWMWFKPKKLEMKLRQLGYTGTPYKLVKGDLKEMTATLTESLREPLPLLSGDIATRIVPFIHEVVKNHGKSVFIWQGPTPTIIIMHPEQIKEITQNMYQYIKPDPSSNPLSRLLMRGLTSLEGEKWAKHRKIIMPAFHVDQLKKMVPAFHATTREMLGKWEEIMSTKSWCELDVSPYIYTLTADGISRTAFGSDFEEGKLIFELQREQSDNFTKIVQSVYIPGWRFVPTKFNRRTKEIAKTVDDKIKNIVNKRIKTIGEGEKTTENTDLLRLLLESNSIEIENQKGNKDSGMSIEDIIQECKLFYLAGQETTSRMLVWTMIMLSFNLDWQARAREEVLHVFGTEIPDFDGLNKLKIMTMIFNEVLRLYPPASVLQRAITEETKLGNATLPAGVQMLLPPILIHQDPDIWGEDVKEFKPERFSEGVFNATKGRLSFFPFGWGPRICPGQNFAMLEAKTAMTMILQRFSLEISPSYVHAPCRILTIQPQYGAQLILRKL